MILDRIQLQILSTTYTYKMEQKETKDKDCGLNLT